MTSLRKILDFLDDEEYLHLIRRIYYTDTSEVATLANEYAEELIDEGRIKRNQKEMVVKLLIEEGQ